MCGIYILYSEASRSTPSAAFINVKGCIKNTCLDLSDMHLCRHKAISPQIQVMPFHIHQEVHDKSLRIL